MIPMPAFFSKIRPKIFDVGQYGLVASKRLFKKATDRNRAKRLLRTWIGQNVLPKEFDILFIARAPILETTLQSGADQITRMLRRMKSLEKDGWKAPAKTERAKNSTRATDDDIDVEIDGASLV